MVYFFLIIYLVSYIEMLIVLFVIGALLVIIVPNLSATGAQAQEKVSQGKTYPTNMTDLITAGFLKEKPSCPAYLQKKGEEAGETTESVYTFKVDQIKGIQVFCTIHDGE